ncbi:MULTISPECIES: hypothetical protein [Parabacteroides]|uniref:hypothetical protein n=1 Tax=Parabacteroides leei TaxID=2939491 RepID=UPI00189AA09E|nr:MULTISPECIES: hypothetical protein [Parabacteroides]MCL3850859.1 hypothetical protein [Parabacteroides leei]
MKKYFLFVFLVSAWAFTSCDNDDAPDIDADVPFYQNLGVAYDVTNNTTRVGANFNKLDSAGINIKLNGPASITINGKTPDFDNVGTYFYTYSFSGLDDMTFVFTRAKDSIYTNVASINDVKPIAIPESFTSAKITGTTTLTWEGDPVGKDEVVGVQITYNGGSYNILNRTEGSKSIDINFSNMVNASKGTLSLSRAKILPLQEDNGNAGGQLDVSYIRSKEIALE